MLPAEAWSCCSAMALARSAPASAIPWAPSPLSLAAADLDNDGNVDIATANPADNSVSVLHGDGAGNFGPADALTAGNTPRGHHCRGRHQRRQAGTRRRQPVPARVGDLWTRCPRSPTPPPALARSPSPPTATPDRVAAPGHHSTPTHAPASTPSRSTSRAPGRTSSRSRRPLPIVTDPMTIDGTTQPGYHHRPARRDGWRGAGDQCHRSRVRRRRQHRSRTGDSPGSLPGPAVRQAGDHQPRRGRQSSRPTTSACQRRAPPLSRANRRLRHRGHRAHSHRRHGPQGATSSRARHQPRSRSAVAAPTVIGNYIGITADGSNLAVPNAAGNGIEIHALAARTPLTATSSADDLTGIFIGQPATDVTVHAQLHRHQRRRRRSPPRTSERVRAYP